MKLLILGGTVFLGPHLVTAALARGHEVTLFNRGQHNIDLFPDVEKLRGDRDGGLQALQGRTWDAVIDTSGYVPRLVRDAATLLRDAVDHYTFISSISVYSEDNPRGLDESGTVGTLQDTTVEEITGETYGPLKALCEQAVEETLPGRTLIIRPGLIVGPDDPTDRFTYWPHRVAQGGDVLAPGRPGHQVQIIDVRDLAEWTVRMVEASAGGTYNATGPDYTLTMGAVLDTCKDVSASDVRFVWIDEQFLLDRGIQPWSEAPLWLPEADDTLSSVDVRKALAAGLTFRPLAETVRDTLAWDAARPAGYEWRAGLSGDREREVLAAWRGR